MDLDKIKTAPFVLFCLLTSKLLIIPASWQDVGLFLILGCVTAIVEHKIENSRMSELEVKLAKMSQSLEENKLAVASLKMSTGMTTRVLR